MPNTLKIQGLDAVNRALKQLEPTLARKGIRKAMRRALAPMRDDIAAALPVDTGNLKRSVKIRAGKGGRGKISVRIVIGKSKAGPFYGAFRDLGTKRMDGSHAMQMVFKARAKQAKADAERYILEELEATIMGLRGL